MKQINNTTHVCIKFSCFFRPQTGSGPASGTSQPPPRRGKGVRQGPLPHIQPSSLPSGPRIRRRRHEQEEEGA